MSSAPTPAASAASGSRKLKRHALLARPLFAADVPNALLSNLRIRTSPVLEALEQQVGEEEGEESEEASSGESESESDEEDEALREAKLQREAATARDPFFWFVTPQATAAGGAEDAQQPYLEQTQLGVYRALLAPSRKGAAPIEPLTALSSLQAARLSIADVASLQRSAGSGAATTLRKLKSGPGAEEAAQMLSATFLDARPLLGPTDAALQEEDESDSEAESYASSTPQQQEEEGDDGASSIVTAASSLRLTPSASPPKLRTWTILLLGGGHFGAVIVALNPFPTPASKRTNASEQRYLVLAHKAFHRYTTRKKQGGGQAAQDATGRFAKSAGAQLRRYGEQALAEEIRELLRSKAWRVGIEASERVWVRAGARSARGILWSWPGAGEASPLEAARTDGRVGTIPFATRRPSPGEALRVFAELTRVKVRHLSDAELEARDASYRAQVEGGAKLRLERVQREREKAARERARAERERARKAEKEAAQAFKLDPKEALRRDRLERLVEMLRRGRTAAAVNHLARYEVELLRPSGWNAEPLEGVNEQDARRRIDATLPLWWRAEDARQKGVLRTTSEMGAIEAPTQGQLVPATLLHVAAEGGDEEALRYLLIERRADLAAPITAPPSAEDLASPTTAIPSALPPAPHRTAYDLCPTKGARDVFRRLMAAQPDWCADWSGMSTGGARVPSALTEEMEARQVGKTKDRRALLREKAKAREEERNAKEAANPTPTPTAPVEEKRESSATKNKLGGTNTAPRALLVKQDEAAGLTPEMRARIEREKRARAAEARMKALQGGAGGGGGAA